MYRLIRFYNQNRKVIIRAILVIALIIIIIQLLNNSAKKQNREKVSANTNTNLNNEIKNETLISNKSSVTGETVNSSNLENSKQLINSFMNYCNEKKLNEAYSLISNDCKNEMFATVEDFKTIYYDNVFNNTTKLYTIENYVDNIYEVNIKDNILSTGKIDSENNISNYIAIVKDEVTKENKLNINNFIKKDEINKQYQNSIITFNFRNKLQYMDYTYIDVDITNNSDQTIILDDLQTIYGMYLIDDNNIRYYAYTNELSKAQLTVGSGGKTTIRIKYFCKYNSTRKIKQIGFSNLILGYDRKEYIFGI